MKTNTTKYGCREKYMRLFFSSDARISYFHPNQWFPYWIMIILLNHPTSEWGNGPIHNSITMKKLKLLLIWLLIIGATIIITMENDPTHNYGELENDPITVFTIIPATLISLWWEFTGKTRVAKIDGTIKWFWWWFLMVLVYIHYIPTINRF